MIFGKSKNKFRTQIEIVIDILTIQNHSNDVNNLIRIMVLVRCGIDNILCSILKCKIGLRSMNLCERAFVCLIMESGNSVLGF